MPAFRQKQSLVLSVRAVVVIELLAVAMEIERVVVDNGNKATVKVVDVSDLIQFNCIIIFKYTLISLTICYMQTFVYSNIQISICVCVCVLTFVCLTVIHARITLKWRDD